MTAADQPGLDARRLVRLMESAVERCQLDLSRRTVLTEAASGAYVVTPVLAALAGADVYALAAGTSYATAGELAALTSGLARLAGVADRVQLVREKAPDIVGAADIITNSGQVRPIDAAMVARLKPSAVIPLMYESWEYRGSERHPAVDVFSFLGAMAMKQLHDAGIAVYGSRIVVLCDNAFAPFITDYLRSGGADVAEAAELTQPVLATGCDAVLLALQPGADAALAAADAKLLAEEAPGAVLVQYWGDVDRDALTDAGVPVWPPRPPAPGHMGVLPSAIGPEPIVRLQSGGLKVGELLARGLDQVTPGELALVQSI